MRYTLTPFDLGIVTVILFQELRVSGKNICMIWNRLPAHLRFITSRDNFKKFLKEHFMESIPV
jgi:hypothetical protein